MNDCLAQYDPVLAAALRDFHAVGESREHAVQADAVFLALELG